MKATYVSVWDNGVEVRTNCEYEVGTNIVTNIDTSDDEVGDCCLLKEFIELPDGTEVMNFYDADNERQFIDGVGEDVET